MCVPIEPLLNKGKPLANVLNQSKIAVSTTSKKPVTVPFNESMEYEPTFTYGFESESRKRSLGAGYNCKAKKHCCVLPICLVFEGMKDSEKIKKPRHMYNASICYCIFVE